MDSRLENFGKYTFNKKEMKNKLPYPIYMKWKNAIRKEEVLDKVTADIIAHAMKEWAIEHGATHYCHWFQPLNGYTAKKHENFVDKTDENLSIIRFSGNELIKSEPDASSFPSGGMRSTFEARGYTYWDCTANAFIMDNILYIPSIFVSFSGESLDKKSPLLKSMDFISTVSTKIYNLFSKEKIFRVRAKVGLEQEFFLIDRKLYEKRVDIINTGRTLVGDFPPKDQELLNHYFGSIPNRVMKFYNSINKKFELLGINAKTEHNEVAPGQFEVAILFDTVNVSVDNNQIVMEVLRTTAYEHDMVCLLHEKPFKGVNGSGKHNNWSLLTNYGKNLFKLPDDGNDVDEILFSIFVIATIAATDKFSSLLRLSSSSTRNDLRLGGDEAPPSILSIYLGNEVENKLYKILGMDVKNSTYNREFNVNNLGYAPKDSDDRNRTSPFAYTGGKFEFRMLGSMQSAADCNIILNTIVGNELNLILEGLSNVKESELITECKKILRALLEKHSRVLFSGDNYSKSWIKESSQRGLKNHKTYLDALLYCKNSSEIDVLLKNSIFTESELKAIYDISIEETINNYLLDINTICYMINKDILPSCLKQLNFELDVLNKINNTNLGARVKKLKDGIDDMLCYLKEFENVSSELINKSKEEKALFLQSKINLLNGDFRKIVDNLERLSARENWNIPTYEEIFRALN